MGDQTLAVHEVALGEVAERALSGPMESADRERLRAAIVQHFHAVWCFLRRLGLSPADADDAVQDVMIVVASKLALIEAGRERSFMFSTAYRIARRVRQAAARPTVADHEVLLNQVDPAPGPEVLADKRKARALLDLVLDGLPMDLRAVFVLAEIDELKGAEIAALLGLPGGTVASRLRRARERFDATLARLLARERVSGGAR